MYVLLIIITHTKFGRDKYFKHLGRVGLGTHGNSEIFYRNLV